VKGVSPVAWQEKIPETAAGAEGRKGIQYSLVNIKAEEEGFGKVSSA